MKNHKKHANLVKPTMGEWGRAEYAIIGTTCDVIEEWTDRVAKALSSEYKISYIDASHDKTSAEISFHQKSTQHKSHVSVDIVAENNKYQHRLMYHDSDLILVNGNHFTADRQIVFIDERKRESLSRKKDRLTHVELVIIKDEGVELYDFLKDLINENTPIIAMDDTDKIMDYLKVSLSKNDKLKGLILAGGKSQRMGHDKTVINYHGTNQVDHLHGVMSQHCAEVFVSLRDEQKNVFIPSEIKDKYLDLGPMGGILSAFRTDPDAAWLVIAADLPFVDEAAIATLMSQRDKSKIATCFIKADAEFPDPLCTIWEPKSYLKLLEFLALGYSCPRKVLINNDVKQIVIHDVKILMNVNDQDDLANAKQMLQD